MTDPSIDLRSDTVTEPTAEMRSAMANAAVGDDVFGEDPTVRALEERVAALLGKAAGLYVPSGTMANLIAVLIHASQIGEVIADDESHLVLNEAGGATSLGRAMVRTLRSDENARFDERLFRSAFRDPTNDHHPRTRLVVLENTHAHRMGAPLDAEYMERLAAISHEHNAAVHVDGARILNAAVALGVDPHALVEPVDSASVCLSKGLACPAGSVVVGTEEFIAEARRIRKLLGGGQRQIGIMAAAGLIALGDEPGGTIRRLVEDHRRARSLANGLAAIDGVDIDAARVRTNIVIFGLRGTSDPDLHRDRFVAGLKQRGVKVMPYPRSRVRVVTHIGVDDHHIERALEAVAATIEHLHES